MTTRIFFRNVVRGILSLVLIAGLVSCEDDNNNKNPNNDTLYKDILNNYVETTVVPTYKKLAEASLVMRSTTRELKNNPTATTMKAAADAWMAARIEWELSEAFLFGPVGEHALNIDAHIDSWPLELNDILQSINSGANITGKEAWLLEPEVIGFHVTEYLLYREGKARPVEDLIAKPAEFNYLVAATDALVWDCVLAYAAWIGESNLPSDMKSVFRENQDIVNHLEENPDFKNFSQTLKNGAGIYKGNISSALGEIAGGAAEIAGEVGATKIASPYEGQKVEDVESWYSWHSLDDYTNNILSIKNAYLGGLNDNSRTSVSFSTYVARVNPTLDKQIKEKIEDCLVKIAAIGTGGKSFYEVVKTQTNKAQVEAAVDACSELESAFKTAQSIIE